MAINENKFAIHSGSKGKFFGKKIRLYIGNKIFFSDVIDVPVKIERINSFKDILDENTLFVIHKELTGYKIKICKER